MRIAECLIKPHREPLLLRQAVRRPEYLVTAHTALGLRAEGHNKLEKAKRHYKEALGSYLEDWFEYDLARERLNRLKQLSVE